MTLSTDTLLNHRYRIQSILAQGGMGAVYRAFDEVLEIPVAVKENLFLTEEYARQFQREAIVLAGMRHASLPRVADYFAIPGQGQYLIMDYIEGEDLRQRLERMDCVPARDVVMIGAAICDALTYLHSRRPQIVHRDIKPGNIKITPEGEVILVDFGLVKVIEGSASQATTTGARAMTPGYSPPEQYGTARTDPRSDIYSLAATLYAALTGTIPEDALARATGKEDLTPLRFLQPYVNKRLAGVIEKALSIDPDERYQSAEEFKKNLLIAGEMSHMAPQTVYVTPPPPPPDSGENAVSEPVRDSNRKSKKKRMSISQMRRRKERIARIARMVAFTLLLLLASVVAAFVYFQPGAASTLVQQALGVLPLATPTNPAVIPSASATSAPTLTITPLNTGTPTSQAVVNPTLEAATPTSTNTPSPDPQATPTGGGPGQVAFASNRMNNTFQIWVIDPLGGAPKQISDMPEGACQPAWSPSGNQIAFISPCRVKNDSYPESKIYIMDWDGNYSSNLREIPQSSIEGDFDPAWSPDGTSIAFTSLRSQVPHIFLVTLGDGSIQELSESRFGDRQPAWDPSGKNLAVARMGPSTQIWILPTNGQAAWQFTQSGEVINQWPVWYPDGLSIFYTQIQSLKSTPPWLVRRYFEDRDITREYDVPSTGSGLIGPIADVTISPDGRWLAFESWPDGNNHDIYLMDVDGGNRVRLTKDPAWEFGAAWRPAPLQP